MGFDTNCTVTTDDPTGIQVSQDNISWTDPSDITQGTANTVLLSLDGLDPTYAFYRIVPPLAGVTFAGGKPILAQSGIIVG